MKKKKKKNNKTLIERLIEKAEEIDKTLIERLLEKTDKIDAKLKVVICIIVTIVSFFGAYVLLEVMEKKENEYDKSLIYQLDGVVVDAYFESEYHQDTGYKSRAYLDIELETGDIVTIGVGGSLSEEVGDKIIVYTNGEHYALSERGVATEAQDTIWYFLSACFAGVIPIIAWTIMFGSKGFWIGAIIFLLAFGISEAI